MRPGLLRGYTHGLDGLFRKRVTFGDEVDILYRDPHGRLTKVEHIERNGQQITCTTLTTTAGNRPALNNNYHHNL